LGIGDWGLGIGHNPQSTIPNPQSPSITLSYYLKYNVITTKVINVYYNLIIIYFMFKKLINFQKRGLGIGDWAQSPIPNPQSPKNIIYYTIYNIML